MKLPLQISFHNTKPLPDVEEVIRDRATRLERYCGTVTSCRVVIDVPHKKHQTGNRYQVRIDVTVPGDEIAITREAAEREDARNLAVAIKDAFEAADRLVAEYVQRIQGGKRHERA